MAEVVIPGTYISVRAEGLISAGRVATGIVGVVGTASAGPVGEPVALSDFAHARELYGLPDNFHAPEDGSTPLTLNRALQQIYANGASTVVAVRVASSTAAAATFTVRDDQDHTVALLAAGSPGTWANDLEIGVTSATAPARIVGERHTESFDALIYGKIRPSRENRIQVQRGETKRVAVFNIVYRWIVRNEDVTPNASGDFVLANPPVSEVEDVNEFRVVDSAGAVLRTYGSGAILYGSGGPPATGEMRVNPSTGELTFEAAQVPAAGQKVIATYGVEHDDPEPGEVLVTVWNGDLDFASGEAPKAANGDVLTANYLVEAADAVEVSLTHGMAREAYTVLDGRSLARQLVNSALVRGVADPDHGSAKPATGVRAYFGTGGNTRGANGADAGPDEYAGGLETLANRLVNIVVLAGQDATMGSVLVAHLKATEETDFERIGVLGAPGRTVAEALGHSLAEDRVVLVAPGIRYPDGTTLPAAYTAAAVAGLMSAQAVQTSLTNRPVNVPRLAWEANRGEQEQLIRRNVLTVARKDGHRVVKGLTTQGESQPFSAIPTRRIVDYAKYGVRSAANPYLGRLNNSRVRAALKATLDAFLTRMVEDEALTGYHLEVAATRAQEIAGEVSVIMTIQPTFSIDYIRVTMVLR
jgi:hypothetical protein